MALAANANRWADISAERKVIMAKSNNRWDVIYERIDARTNKSVVCYAAKCVDWRSALVVKRNHRTICAMKIRPTSFAADAANAGDDRGFLAGLAIGLQNGPA